MAYAEKNLPDDLEANAKAKEYSEIMIRDYRKQNALKHIKKLLVGSNYDDEELTNACDLAVIDKFRKALGLDSTCMPRWYRIVRFTKTLYREVSANPQLHFSIDLDPLTSLTPQTA